MKFVWVMAIFCLTVFTAFGDAALKEAGKNKYINVWSLILGLIVYVCAGLVWFLVYKHTEFSSAGAIYGAATALIFALVGVFYFNEIVTPIEIVGIIFAVLAIFILGRFGS